MFKFKWTLKEAYIYVIGKRQCIRPNISFLQQLWQYETVLFGEECEHSVQHKDLRIISRLHRKLKKELQPKGADKESINRETIIQINSSVNFSEENACFKI